jgi:hypothetical protein
MKALITAIALAVNVSATVPLCWQVDLDASSDPFDFKTDPPSGWVATLTCTVAPGDETPYITMDLSSIYQQRAGFVRDVEDAGPYGIWVRDYLVRKVPYAMDPSYKEGIEGRLISLMPTWIEPDGSWTTGAHYRGVWTACVVPPPQVPEPSQYAAVFALGLAGFAVWRRVRK